MIILALAVAAFQWRRGATPGGNDPYAALPFRPAVAFDSQSVTVSNTEDEPYLETRLNLYVGVIVYSVPVGLLRPGEAATRSLGDFKNEQGESFDPATHKAILLEVRARFGGYDSHKDFSPPR